MIETSSRVVVHDLLRTPPVLKDAAVLVAPELALSPKPGRGGTILRAAIAIPLLALAMLLIVFGLVPAVFVALVAFLPALLPMILVGLGILATAELKTPGEHRLCEPNQPCCCGRHGTGLEEKPRLLS